MMANYQGKKIVIVGLGLTGISCINFFITRGIIPRVMDTRLAPPWISKVPKQIECYLGGLNDEWLQESDLIIKSPGLALSHPSLKAAANAGIEIIGDIELFCREAHAPIVAITGSNGKSTVAILVEKMAKSAGINASIGGNIGRPALTLLNTPSDLYVLELSSFQLETTFSLKTIAATILNITREHMDRYPLGLQEYRASKLRIYKNSKVCVVNADSNLTMPVKGHGERCISFGIDTGDYNLKYYKNETWLCVKGEKVLNTKEMKLTSQHNYINALAALALADTTKLPRDLNLKTIASFCGLQHRFQLVLERNGIRWINDSKATNVSSTKAALNSLQVRGTLHLLLGGDGKSSDFLSLRPYLFCKKKLQLYCFGRDGKKLATLRPEISERTETMEQAMYLLASRLGEGDVVLLSPACASLDQFKDFEHRGLVFTRLAKKLG